MTVSELGSLGEFVASIATVITLIYLAVQIRDNSRSQKRETRRASLADARLWRSHIIENPDLAGLYTTGLLSPENLDQSSRVRFRMLMHSLVEIWAFAFQNDPARTAAQEKFIVDTLRQPGGTLAWKGVEHSQSKEFRDYVNRLLRKELR